MTALKHYLQSMYCQAEDLNTQNVLEALSTTGPHSTLLDVGCWDGSTTLNWAKAAQAKHVFGLEPVSSAATLARNKKIKVSTRVADVQRWDFEDNSVDCLVSNQVVEHLSNLDHFISECYRTIKPGGFLITSTNNLASWHNIFALVFGWAPFDLTNSSKKSLGLGNPLAAHRSESDPRGATWTHKCIYTTRWLSEWFTTYGFVHKTTLGAGFYPFPAKLGKWFPLHSAFITVVCQKPI